MSPTHYIEYILIATNEKGVNFIQVQNVNGRGNASLPKPDGSIRGDRAKSSNAALGSMDSPGPTAHAYFWNQSIFGSTNRRV